MRLACQDYIIPGDDILEKWEFAGYLAMECGIRGDAKTVLLQVVGSVG